MGKNRGLFWIVTGLLLIAAALAIVIYNGWDERRAESTSTTVANRLEESIYAEQADEMTEETPTLAPETECAIAAETAMPEAEITHEEAIPENALIPEDEPSDDVNVPEDEMPEHERVPEKEMPVRELDGDKYIGILEIPSYDLKLPVMSRWSYPFLRKAPCRYYGSVYADDLVIAAHNYRRHFGCLTNLREGDKIIFTDVQGNVFTYQVLFRETLMPYDVEKMIEGDWDLTLFTCTLGGSYRVTVRCERTDK